MVFNRANISPRKLTVTSVGASKHGFFSHKAISRPHTSLILRKQCCSKGFRYKRKNHRVEIKD